MSSKKTYSEMLKHPKWQKKRLEVLERANFECELCGDGDSTLNVHHGYYRKGNKPWEYRDESFHCLCEDCHSGVTETVAYMKELIGLSPVQGLYFVQGFLMAAASFRVEILVTADDDHELLNGFCAYFRINTDKFMEVLNTKGMLSGGWDMISLMTDMGWNR
jgi:hypothetical protein